MNAAKYILHYICFAECMLPNTFCIIYVLRNECCQICFGLYMFCGMNAAKYGVSPKTQLQVYTLKHTIS